MFSRLKRIAAPVILSIGRVGSSLSGAFFNIKSVLGYFTRASDTAPLNLTVELIAVLANMVVNLATRVPAIFRQYTAKPAEASHSTQESRSCITSCFPGENPKQVSIVLLFKAMGYVNGFYTTLGAYNGGIYLAEFIAELTSSSAHDAYWKEALVQGFALYLAISNLSSFNSYVLPKIERNAMKLVKHLDSPDTVDRRAAAEALAISGAGLISGPMVGFFTTGKALDKIETNIRFLKFPERMKSTMAYLGALSGFTTATITILPSCYDNLKKNKMEASQADSCIQSCVRYTTYVAGIPDAIATGLQNFNGVVSTSNEVLGVDKYGWVIVPAGLCGMSTAVSHFIFNIKLGVDECIEQQKKHARREGYDRIPDVEAAASSSAIAVPSDNANQQKYFSRDSLVATLFSHVNAGGDRVTLLIVDADDGHAQDTHEAPVRIREIPPAAGSVDAAMKLTGSPSNTT